MSWSLNEVETLARKAARGAGLSWGLSEEAGKTARWLTSVQFPGPAMLADLLAQNDGTAHHRLCPTDTSAIWTAAGGTLCPLTTGAAICDHASEIAAGRTIQLGRTAYPLLLVPYVAAAADQTGTPMMVTWGDMAIILGDGAQINMPDPATANLTMTETVEIMPAGDTSGQPLPHTNRGDMSSETAKALNTFAHRTYAPDTAESRLAGAGAGLTDND